MSVTCFGYRCRKCPAIAAAAKRARRRKGSNRSSRISDFGRQSGSMSGRIEHGIETEPRAGLPSAVTI